jgi:2-amino-4-hydroxy-6-hydroxymethyldihydropteridine diphosphokinase
MKTAYLSLGSNLGDRKDNLLQAVNKLSMTTAVMISCTSSLYETDPVGYQDQRRFLNMVLAIETDLEPQELLSLCKQIEREQHRIPTFRNGPRSIDLDILLYDRICVDSQSLIIPHPRMFDRAFVMIPLMEIMGILPENGVNHPSVCFFERLEDNFWLNR